MCVCVCVQVFIQGTQAECARVLSTILDQRRLCPLISPFFTPNAAPNQLVSLYQDVVTSLHPDSADVIFMLLTKVSAARNSASTQHQRCSYKTLTQHQHYSYKTLTQHQHYSHKTLTQPQHYSHKTLTQHQRSSHKTPTPPCPPPLQFDLSLWLSEAQPVFGERTRLLELLHGALCVCGREPDPELLTPFHLFTRHWTLLLRHHFPDHYSDCLRLLMTSTCVCVCVVCVCVCLSIQYYTRLHVSL